MHAAWRQIRRWLRADHGQAAPLLAMTMTAFFGVGALTVDVGYIWHEHQNVQNAVDAGALAGAQALPDNAVEAESKALEFVLANAPDLTSADVHISFRCLVGDRNLDRLRRGHRLDYRHHFRLRRHRLDLRCRNRFRFRRRRRLNLRNDLRLRCYRFNFGHRLRLWCHSHNLRRRCRLDFHNSLGLRRRRRFYLRHHLRFRCHRLNLGGGHRLTPP